MTVNRSRDRIIADLTEQLLYSESDLRALDGAMIFITGGTGFVGSWLLESIVHANALLHCKIQATVLTRDYTKFEISHPHLANSAAIKLIEGDIRNLSSDLPRFDAIVHAATPASAELNRDQPFEMLDTIIDGGRRISDIAIRSGRIPLLFTSSGAVYGRQPHGISHTSEEYGGGPDQLSHLSAYAEGKRVGEFQCAVAAQVGGVQAKIARLFAFVGPYLPTDRHLAIGNFLADAHAGRKIQVAGDGTTIRSYQYAAEMVTWLWAVLVRGETMRSYNVGSEDAVSMAELARFVGSSVRPSQGIEIHGKTFDGAVVDRYVPSTERIRRELGVCSTISLVDSLRRTSETM